MTEPSPAKRTRKPREKLSCAECRRAKLKCDRKIPCSNCIRKQCADSCPYETTVVDREDETTVLKRRLALLQGVMEAHGLPTHPATPALTAPVPAPHPSVTPPTTSSTLPHPPQNNWGDHSLSDLPPKIEQPNPPRTVSFAFAPTGPLITPGDPQDLNNNDEPSYGTLVISSSGRSKYLGPSAASDWLRDQETQQESPMPSRPPSPSAAANAPVNFPFHSSGIRTQALLQGLPTIEEANVLVDYYYRVFAWEYNVITRDKFEGIFKLVYEPYRTPDPQDIALVAIVMAMGGLMNLELPPNDPSAEEFYKLSCTALAKGNFMSNYSTSGAQTLHIMAHYHLQTERGRNGDSAWPLWGLSMRLIQGMGMHRDGARWNLPEDVIDIRRRLFWEAFSADVFQAHCFSRPCSMAPGHFDTQLPNDPQGRGFYTVKFEFCRLSCDILHFTMRVDPPPYSHILRFHDELIAFEKQIPYRYRSRTALFAVPSMYADSSVVLQEAPEQSRRDLALTLQQTNLAMLVAEAYLSLHRPYFAKALHETDDPTKSVYHPSYMAVIERCNAMVACVSNVYSSHPNVSSRHWNLWYHLFNSAVCLITLAIRHPRSPLASFALEQVDVAIGLTAAVAQTSNSKRLMSNLQCMLRLRTEAQSKLSTDPVGDVSGGDENADAELLGWRTRLIERAGKGVHSARTISATSPSSSMANTTTPDTLLPASVSALQEHFNADAFFAPGDPGSTDEMLHTFWDPRVLASESGGHNDGAPAVNWWDV